jgi:putative FmdB family regulatory protein
MTYEYVCTSCDHQWEAEQSISAPALKECPSCHASTAKRHVSGGAGFILKGGGWYADGYGSSSSSKKSESSSSGSPSKAGDSGGSSKAETKTETSKTETSTDSKSDTPAGPKGGATAAA